MGCYSTIIFENKYEKKFGVGTQFQTKDLENEFECYWIDDDNLLKTRKSFGSNEVKMTWPFSGKMRMLGTRYEKLNGKLKETMFYLLCEFKKGKLKSIEEFSSYEEYSISFFRDK